MKKYRVLFLCIHNSARSQMAEAFLKRHGCELFDAESAGLEPGKLNPNVVEVMKESGIDISGNATKSVFDLYKRGESFSHVVTVCDREAAERCPVFLGVAARLHWPFPDPSKFQGSRDEMLEKTREVRDQIEAKVKEFIRNVEDELPYPDDDLFKTRP